MTPRLSVITFAFWLALLMGACSPAPDRLGVSTTPNGDLTIHYMRCVDRAEQIDVLQVAMPQGAVTDEEVLWGLRRDDSFVFPEGDRLAEEVLFQAGQVPEGFIEAVPFESPIPEDSSLRVLIQSSLDTTAMGVRISELEPGRILQANEQGFDQQVSPSQFRDNSNGCESPSGILGGFTTLVAILVGLALLAVVTTIGALVRSSRGNSAGRGQAARQPQTTENDRKR